MINDLEKLRKLCWHFGLSHNNKHKIFSLTHNPIIIDLIAGKCKKFYLKKKSEFLSDEQCEAHIKNEISELEIELKKELMEKFIDNMIQRFYQNK